MMSYDIGGRFYCGAVKSGARFCRIIDSAIQTGKNDGMQTLFAADQCLKNLMDEGAIDHPTAQRAAANKKDFYHNKTARQCHNSSFPRKRE